MTIELQFTNSESSARLLQNVYFHLNNNIPLSSTEGELNMKTPILGVVLLCIFSLFPLTISAQIETRCLCETVLSTSHVQQEVLYNVSDTGDAFFIQGHYVIIMSDHHGNITFCYVCYDDTFSITLPPPKRVVFKLGIFEPFFYVPEGFHWCVETYFLEDLPKDADIVSLVKLFGCKLGQGTYDSGFDLDSNNIINMRDIAKAILNFRQIQAGIP